MTESKGPSPLLFSSQLGMLSFLELVVGLLGRLSGFLSVLHGSILLQHGV